MAQKNITNFLEGQYYKQGGMGKDGTGRYGKHHRMKKTTLDETRECRGEDGERRATQVMDWSPDSEGEAHKRQIAIQRKNGQETIREDIRCMDMTWREAV